MKPIICHLSFLPRLSSVSIRLQLFPYLPSKWEKYLCCSLRSELRCAFVNTGQGSLVTAAQTTLSMRKLMKPAKSSWPQIQAIVHRPVSYPLHPLVAVITHCSGEIWSGCPYKHWGARGRLGMRAGMLHRCAGGLIPSIPKPPPTLFFVPPSVGLISFHLNIVKSLVNKNVWVSWVCFYPLSWHCWPWVLYLSLSVSFKSSHSIVF